MDEHCKVVIKWVDSLAKYDKVDKDGKVKSKGKFFGGSKEITKVEYHRKVGELCDQVSRLDGDQANRMSAMILEKRPDAPALIAQVRNFLNRVEIEGGMAAGRTIDPVNPNAPGVQNVSFCQSNSRMEKIVAIFSRQGIEQAYSDDVYAKQCEEIETLLKGGELEHSKKREVGQEAEVQALTDLLAQTLPNSLRTVAAPQTAVNTARGPGPMGLAPPPPNPMGMGMPPASAEIPNTARRIDPRPKCLTARAPTDPTQKDYHQPSDPQPPNGFVPPPDAGPSGQLRQHV